MRERTILLSLILIFIMSPVIYGLREAMTPSIKIDVLIIGITVLIISCFLTLFLPM